MHVWGDGFQASQLSVDLKLWQKKCQRTHMVLVINIRFPLGVETDQTKQSKSTYITGQSADFKY